MQAKCQIYYNMNLLLRLVRSPIGRLVTAWIFAHMSFVVPVDRLRETKNLVVFNHPSPDYRVHILIVPKMTIRSLSDLKPSDSEFLVELFQVVNKLVSELALDDCGYRLIVNGGKYQDVPQLHFHLISD
jgi:histidine triad (HIT) family protein